MTNYVGDGGDNEFFLTPADGDSTVHGGGGMDTLTVDWSALTESISAEYAAGAGFVSGGGLLITFDSIEILDLTFGGGGNEFISGPDHTAIVRSGAGHDFFYTSGVVTIEAGEGDDAWTGDYEHETTPLSLTQTGPGALSLSNGTEVSGIESFVFTGGAGPNSVSIASGFSSVYLYGHGSLTVDWSDKTSDITGYRPHNVRGNHELGYLTTTGAQVYFDEFNGPMVLRLGSGNDTFVESTPFLLVLDAGAGMDVFKALYYLEENDVSFTLDESPDTFSTFVGHGSRIANVEALDVILGLGNDLLVGGSYDDILGGSIGTNTLKGMGGNDRFISDGTDTIDGGEGDDTVVIGGKRADYTIEYRQGQVIVTRTADPDDSPKFLTNVEHIEFADMTLDLDPADPSFGAVDDEGFVTAFNTQLAIPKAQLLANDVSSNGALYFFDARNPEHGTLRETADGVIFTPERGYAGPAEFVYYIAGASGELDAATVRLTVSSPAKGTEGDDRTFGTAAANKLFGLAGNDLLYGLAGSDRLYGGDGEDRIIGGDGDDVLYGDNPNDRDDREGFADTFVFDADDGSDKVFDFEVGLDRAELVGSGNFALLHIASGNTIVTFGATKITFYDAILTMADFDFIPA